MHNLIKTQFPFTFIVYQFPNVLYYEKPFLSKKFPSSSNDFNNTTTIPTHKMKGGVVCT